MKYTGPAQPTQTHREPVSDRAELIIYAVLAALVAAILYLE